MKKIVYAFLFIAINIWLVIIMFLINMFIIIPYMNNSYDELENLQVTY